MHSSTLRILVFSISSVCTLALQEANGSTVSRTYTDLGQVATYDGPRSDVSDVTQFAYDAQGNLTTVTNPLGQVVTLVNFDSFGNPGSVTDPNGVVTTLTYTPQGWLASSSTGGATSQYEYNAVGDVTKITAGDGSFLAYTYDDARRLVAVTNTLGETLNYTLDAMGNRTSSQIKDASGTLTQQQQRTYDELGRLLTAVGAYGQITRYGYDLNDQQTLKTDARSHSTNQAFDALGRISQVNDPLGGVTTLTYNADDKPVQVVDPRGVTTQYTYDGEGRMLTSVSPDGGTSTFAYDDAGNVIQKTDPRGVVTTYQYDALNRLTARRYPANPSLNVTYTYDQTDSGNKGIGHLTRVQDASGALSYQYDSRGQLVAQNRVLDLAGLTPSETVGYSYDSAGRVIQQSYPDNLALTYVRNTAGQVGSINLSINGQTVNVVRDIGYMPFGPIRQLTWNNGWAMSRTYDQDSRLTNQTTGSWQSQYGFDPVGNITSLQSNVFDSVQYQYDALDRLTQEQTASQKKDYTLDAVGNRTQRTTTDLASSTVSDNQQSIIETGSNRLSSVNGLSMAHDEAGNIVLHTNGQRYAYDETGRMVTVYQAGTQRIADYRYNALGQRSIKLVSDPVSGTLQSASSYLYGSNGELLGQSDYSPNGQRQLARYWVWLDGMPLAQIEVNFTQGQPSGLRLVYLHPDHLNTPRLATTNSAVVWAWNSDAYGNGQPNEDVDGDGVATRIPLRFPGQIYDAQTQLSYNYFRDYDANLGRYAQSDPIGLVGGINTYTYGVGNPILLTDPSGLNPIAIGMTVGAEAGTAIFPGAGTIVGGAIGAGLGLWAGDKIADALAAQPMQASGLPPGVWPADTGSSEWGRRTGVGAKEGRGRFHGIKQSCPGSKATDVFGVNPETGDVYDPVGDIVGNLEDVKSK